MFFLAPTVTDGVAETQTWKLVGERPLGINSFRQQEEGAGLGRNWPLLSHGDFWGWGGRTLGHLHPLLIRIIGHQVQTAPRKKAVSLF